jgi:hypothetical protein
MKLLAAALVFASATAWAEDPQTAPAATAQGPQLSLEGVSHIWYVVPTGATVALASDPWKLVLGAGIDQPNFGRNRSTGDLRPETDPYIKPLVPMGQVALLYTASNDWVDTWIGPAAVGYEAWNGASDAFPDWTGNAYWALKAGMKRERLTFNAHGLESGYSATASAEWSPYLLSLKGTDYYQAGVRTSWFVPLWDLPGDVQLFSGLLALRADAQYTGGSHVPIVKLDPTEIRGYYNSFDARALTVGSAELRMRLPALGTWIPGLWKGNEIVPVGFGFLDAGTYSGFADSVDDSGKSGTLASVGIGGGLEIAQLATPSLTLAVPLIGVKKALWWDAEFNLAF